MSKPKQTLTFDFAKDFDREDEEKKCVEREQRKKANADLRKSAERFARELRRAAKRAGFELGGSNPRFEQKSTIQ